MGKNIFGIGVDIGDVDEFKKASKKKGFLIKVFTEKELKYCFKKNTPLPHLAARYAGKEATIKALNNTEAFQAGLWNFKEIEIYNDSDGRPKIRFSQPELRKVQAKISLSHCNDKVIAFVILAAVQEQM